MSKVLVVEDSPASREVVMRILRREGYNVVGAANGVEGLDAVEMEDPDLVLLDVMMPEMDGLTMLEHLREDAVHRDLPVILLTALSDEQRLQRARQLGAQHVVNHASDDVITFVKGLTGRRGCEVVVDSVGEATWPSSLRLLARGGRMVVCGATTGPIVGLDARRLFWHQWSILGSTMGSQAEFREMMALAHSGKFKPVVDSVVPLAEGAKAYARLARGEQVGKLVIEVTS